MIKTTCSFLALGLTLSACASFQPESATTEIVLGDCQNGAVMSQATFGGPLRCSPQSEPAFTEVTPEPES